MIKKFFKLISLLWKCGILAIRVDWMARKADKLEAKYIVSYRAYAIRQNVLRLCDEGESYAIKARTIIGELKRA